MSLDKVKIKKAIDAKILDKKFNKLKWISIYYPDSPEKEISELKDLEVRLNLNRGNQMNEGTN